jgi:hypothetical protein
MSFRYDFRRDEAWFEHVQTKIAELRAAKDARKTWEAHQLELMVLDCTKSLEHVQGSMEKLDVAAREGSKVPHKPEDQWWASPSRFEIFAEHAKRVVHQADRKHNLKLPEYNTTPDDYLKFIAKYGNKSKLRPYRAKSAKLGRAFTEAVANLCNLTVDIVEANGGLSFLLGKLEEVLKLGYYGFTFDKKPTRRSPAPKEDTPPKSPKKSTQKPSNSGSVVRIKNRKDLAAFVAAAPDVVVSRTAYEEDAPGAFKEIEDTLVGLIAREKDRPAYGANWKSWLHENLDWFLQEAISIVM